MSDIQTNITGVISSHQCSTNISLLILLDWKTMYVRDGGNKRLKKERNIGICQRVISVK